MKRLTLTILILTAAIVFAAIHACSAQAAAPAKTVHCRSTSADSWGDLTIHAPAKVGERGIVSDPSHPPYAHPGWNHFPRCELAMFVAYRLTDLEQQQWKIITHPISVWVNGVGGMFSQKWNVRIEHDAGAAFTDVTRGGIRVRFMDYAL
jgi:hypothetical protein